jgi:hypothetical protein
MAGRVEADNITKPVAQNLVMFMSIRPLTAADLSTKTDIAASPLARSRMNSRWIEPAAEFSAWWT